MHISKKTFTLAFLLVFFAFLTNGIMLQASGSKDDSGDSGIKLDKRVNIGTHPVGGAYYSLGAGIAKIISDKTSIQATVYPYAGPDAWMPDFRDNNINMGMISGVDLAWAYNGTVNYDKPTPELRLLVNGNTVPHCTFTVAEKSGITSIKELKGKKVGYEYGGNKFTNLLVDAALASVGLTIDDCVKVPLTDLSTAARALQEQRVDAIFTGSTTTPSSVQLDQAIGIRVLPIGDLKPADIADGVPAKYQEILDEFVPGAILAIAPAKGTLKEDTVLIHYPIDLAVSTKLSDDTVYAVLSVLWDNYKDIAEAHSWGAGWLPETFAIAMQSVPYHDGAVKFFTDKGVWTDKMQARQDSF